MKIVYCLSLLLCLCLADSAFNFRPYSIKNNSYTMKVSEHPLMNGLGKILSHLYHDGLMKLGTKQSQEQDKVLRDTAYSGVKPKVLLIMDDIATLGQLKKFEKINLNITPSIFPKTNHSPITPELARRLREKGRDFMIHLPLEAQQFLQSELMPIKVGTHKELIREKLAGIKADFPSLVFLNNHTGSKFTQSYDDMLNLLEVFDELGLKFIDSVTIAPPVSERIAKEQGKLIMARDVFLDNQTHLMYIKTQIRALISKAQEKGYAIGICHPNTNTFKALAQMSNEIKSKVELISPQDLESYLIANKTTYYVRLPFIP